MDKSTVFDATLYKRKPTDPTRYTDTFLCDEIHANLRAMSFLVPFNAELNAVFVHVRTKALWSHAKQKMLTE